MPTHKTATREEWLQQRLELLKAEKELTRRSDELARKRQALPWVRADKNYSFDTDAGKATLADLFGGAPALLLGPGFGRLAFFFLGPKACFGAGNPAEVFLFGLAQVFNVGTQLFFALSSSLNICLGFSARLFL